ncbi:MAG TPA: 4Fe-4S dicluster domain-containing protein, partial [Burkholderiaceae bacterium]|nr:4Fe-4S dicluster domain-containing protein [Burkholderiaceae bacterium]
MSQDGSAVSYDPTPGMSYDPAEPKYWQPDAVAGEVHRAFEICHGCRMCFKYCDSFPNLFEALDHRVDGDVHRLGPADVARVMDACFQCKLCEVQCPYTPRDRHEFQVDFPKLVHRYRGVLTRGRPRTLQQRVLNDPDGAARMARASFGMANAMNRVRPFRVLLEKAVGIHRDKLLPDFAAEPFDAWAEAEGHVKAEPGGEAVLF